MPIFKKILNCCQDDAKWKKWTLGAIGSIFFYGMYLRFKKLAGHGFWADEYFQLKPMSGSFVEMLHLLQKREFCPYLSGDYYLVYPFFKIFGYNKWGLAIPHIILTVIGFYLLYRVGRRLFKTPIGYLVSFLVVSLNATMINHATEIRAYAVLPTLALACLYFSLQLIEEGALMPLWKKVFVGIVFVGTLWFHLYGLFILFFPLAYALFTKIGDKTFKRALVYTAKFMLVVLLIAMPLWLYSVFGPHLGRGGTRYGFSTFMFIPNPLKDVIGFLKAVLGNLVGFKGLYFLLGALFLPFILPYKERFKQRTFLMTLIFLPIGTLFAMDVSYNYFFVQRQFIWVMPFFALFLAWALDGALVWGLARLGSSD